MPALDRSSVPMYSVPVNMMLMTRLHVAGRRSSTKIWIWNEVDGVAGSCYTYLCNKNHASQVGSSWPLVGVADVYDWVTPVVHTMMCDGQPAGRKAER